MLAEKQQKESHTALIRSKKENGRLSFMDNRPVAVFQDKRVNDIKNNEEGLFFQQKEKSPILQMTISGEVTDDKEKLKKELEDRGFELTKGQLVRLMSLLLSAETAYSSYQDIVDDLDNFPLGLTLSSPPEYKNAIDPTKMIGPTPTTNHQTALLIPHKEPIIIKDQFYRADTRDFTEITLAGGFSAFKEFSIDQAKHFIASWLSFSMPSKKGFSFWWKYPLQRPDIPKNNIPFIATGISSVQMGGHQYKISLHLNFILFDGSDIGIGYNGSTIDTSTILAIQIDRDEVIFLTKIPIGAIQPI